MMLSRFPLAIFLMLILSIAAAAQTATLSGRVIDPQGGVVVGALVTLNQPGVLNPRTTRSGPDGMFSFSEVRTGAYTLQVEAQGFQRWTQDVSLGAEARTMDVSLLVAGINESVSVVVGTPLDLARPEPTASRLNLTPFEMPASVAVVSGDVIRDLGTPTLVQAKGLAPGVTSNAAPGNGGNNLAARGFYGQNSVKQLFNGMEIYNGGNVVSFPFDPWNVDHIGVLYGPSSVLYGTGAIGGAVNVVPKRPDPTSTHGAAAISGGRFGTLHTAFDLTGPIKDWLSYRVNASVRHSNHWVDRGELNSLAVSTSIRVDARDDLRFTFSNDYGDQNPSKYLGTPVLNGSPVMALRRLSTGDGTLLSDDGESGRRIF